MAAAKILTDSRWIVPAIVPKSSRDDVRCRQKYLHHAAFAKLFAASATPIPAPLRCPRTPLGLHASKRPARFAEMSSEILIRTQAEIRMKLRTPNRRVG
jgi:hypothetical protein